MRRLPVVLLIAAIALGTAILGTLHAAGAQDTGAAHHPAVGSWVVHRDPGNPSFPNELMILSADGNAVDFGAYETPGVGAWKATGANTAAVTFTFVTDGPAYVLMRSSVTIAPDGKSFTGTFTSEFIFDPDHAGTSGQIGPGKVDGTRITAEAPGTPVESFPEFFPHPATPAAATPAAATPTS